MPVQANATGDIDACLACLFQQRLAVKITADSGNQMHIATQQGEVMGNVAPDATRRTVDTAWVRGGLRVVDIRHPTNIHVNRPYHHAIGLFGKNVTFSFDCPFTHQVHDVRGDA